MWHCTISLRGPSYSDNNLVLLHGFFLKISMHFLNIPNLQPTGPCEIFNFNIPNTELLEQSLQLIDKSLPSLIFRTLVAALELSPFFNSTYGVRRAHECLFSCYNCVLLLLPPFYELKSLSMGQPNDIHTTD